MLAELNSPNYQTADIQTEIESNSCEIPLRQILMNRDSPTVRSSFCQEHAAVTLHAAFAQRQS